MTTGRWLFCKEFLCFTIVQHYTLSSCALACAFLKPVMRSGRYSYHLDSHCRIPHANLEPGCLRTSCNSPGCSVRFTKYQVDKRPNSASCFAKYAWPCRQRGEINGDRPEHMRWSSKCYRRRDEEDTYRRTQVNSRTPESLSVHWFWHEQVGYTLLSGCRLSEVLCCND